MRALYLTFMLSLTMQGHAQGFEDLLNALKGMGAPIQAPANNAQQPARQPGQSGQPGQAGQPGFGARLTENYCRNIFSVASMEARGPINESLVSEEFNIDPKDFYDEVVKALDAKPGYSGYTFPSPSFYQGEFETDKIDVIFDLLLSYPSPKYAAALIAESRSSPNQPQYDHQARIDAIAALAILHFRMQDKSKLPNRWRELVASLEHEQHYTSHVIWARLLSSGEIGRKDVTQAIVFAREANGLRTKYASENGIRTMSTRNYTVTSNQTLYEILSANGNHPDKRYFAQFMQQYEAITRSSDPVPELRTQLGPGLATIEKSAHDAAEKAQLILTGATQAGNIKAQKASLDSALRNRVSDTSDYNADTRTLATLARELEKVDKLDDSQSKIFGEALKHAHDSGDRAVSMMGPMMNAIMSLMMKRGVQAAPAVIPYSRKLQSYTDRACTVISRLDHAAMVKKSPAAEPERSGLASLMAEK